MHSMLLVDGKLTTYLKTPRDVSADRFYGFERFIPDSPGLSGKSLSY
jgi:hypothetical protein